ncbi:hypothetical protein SAMN05192529_111112 [Arachidicoccus rhizosphaerae]|jgi:hypothetical protein|uniref:Uncharacterized protein n=1 Tax=Arachidicoccus rhizosphaerae TaxID=551991 RepID=A0A1H3ZM29_9BACT|nr:hypothetical protein [Arachidicoccus rhizosphaerae]SEA24707.1 hypothetical protein SAMN05192529_111112 [Arachidicoccus rhizosphaerae]
MKKIIVIMSVLAGVFFTGQSKAQINISINIGSQPEWGPAGYDYVDYYYLPDINAYYNVVTAQYIYLLNNRWHFASTLPGYYRNYNIYNSYKVVVNRKNPYQNNKYDIEHYGKYKGHSPQPMLRDNNAYKAMRNNGNHYGNNRPGNGNNNDRRNTTIVKKEEKKAIKQTNRTIKQDSRGASRTTTSRTQRSR